MGTIKQFEELEVWQLAKALTVKIYRTSEERAFSKDWGLRDQIRRAAVSSMANIAEGFDRSSNKEFINFLHYSLSSVSEVKSHLYLAIELDYLDKSIADELMKTANELSKRLKAFIKYLRSHLIKPA